MLRDRELEQYRRVVEEAVADTGRDDIGVGAVTEAEGGKIAVEFSRGTHTYQAEIPAAALQDHGEARRTINTAILKLSKEVAQEQLEKSAS